MRRKIDLILLLGLFLCIALPRALPFPIDFIAGDERVIWTWSREFANAVLSGHWSGTLNNAYPAVPFMWLDVIRLGLKYLLITATNPAPTTLADVFNETAILTVMPERRMVLALVHTALILCAWRPLSKLFNKSTALIALVLLALDPLVLIQSRLARVEALVGELMLLSVLAMLVYFKQARPMRWLLISAILAGLAILTKVTALFLLPFFGFIFILRQMWGSRRPWGQFAAGAIKALSVWGLVVALVMVLVWPVLWVNPLAALNFILDYLRGASTGQGLYDESGMFFLGHIIQGDPGPLFYLFTLLFRLTPLTGVGLIAGIGWLTVFLVRSRRSSAAEAADISVDSAEAMPFIYLLFFVMGYTVLLMSGFSKSEHYLLPVFMALDVAAALGLVKLGELALKIFSVRKFEFFSRFQNSILSFKPVYITAIIMIQVATVAPYHPYYATYWNPLLGGLRQAIKVYPVINGGEGVDLAMAYLNQKPNPTELTLVCGAKAWDLCHTLFRGTTWAGDAYSDKAGRWVTADYIFIHLPGVQAQLYPAFLLDYLHRQPAEYTVSFDTMAYAWLYLAPAVRRHVGQTLGEAGAALGYNVSSETVTAGNSTTLDLYWQNSLNPPPGRLRIGLVDEDGYEWAAAPVLPKPAFATALTTPEAVLEMTGIFTVPAAAPPGDYRLYLRFISNAAPSTGIDAGRLVVQKGTPAAPIKSLQPENILNKTMGDSRLTLLGFTTRRAAEDKLLWLELYWQAAANISQDYAVQLELFNPAGQPVKRWLAPPLQGRSMTSTWQRGDTFLDPWLLNGDTTLSSGVYEVRLSLLELKTGRLVDAVTVSTEVAAVEAAALPLPVRHQTAAAWGDALTLAGYDLVLSQAEPMVYLDLSLYWRVNDKLAQNQVIVQLLDETGQPILDNKSLLAAAKSQREVVVSRHQLQVDKTRLNPAAWVNYKLAVTVHRLNLDQTASALADGEASPYIIDNLPQKAMIITR